MRRSAAAGVAGVATGSVLGLAAPPGAALPGVVLVGLLAAGSPTMGIGLVVFFLAVQDLPAFGTNGVYASQVVCLAAVTIRLALTPLFRGHSGPFPRTWSLALPVIALVAVGQALIVSASGVYAQSVDRPFAIVAALAIGMITTGWFLGLRLASSARLRSAWASASGAALLVIATAVALQVVFGPSTLKSGIAAEGIMTADQLSSTGLGQTRLTGLSLSPNALVLATAFLIVGSALRGTTGWGARVWKLAVVGAVALVFVAAQSRASGLFLILVAGAYLVIGRVSFGRIVAAPVVSAVVGAAAVGWLISVGSLRFLSPELGLRASAWLAALRELPSSAWVTGTGLSHWPVFFDEQIGVPLMDPHTVVLSAPGTFGLVGVALYGILAVWLLRRVRPAGGPVCVLAVFTLIVLLLGRDLVAVPYLLGNVAFTFQIWLLIGFVVMTWTIQPREGTERRDVTA